MRPAKYPFASLQVGETALITNPGKPSAVRTCLSQFRTNCRFMGYPADALPNFRLEFDYDAGTLSITRLPDGSVLPRGTHASWAKAAKEREEREALDAAVSEYLASYGAAMLAGTPTPKPGLSLLEWADRLSKDVLDELLEAAEGPRFAEDLAAAVDPGNEARLKAARREKWERFKASRNGPVEGAK